MLNKLLDIDEAAANFDLDLIAFLNLDIYSSLTKLIDALGLAEEKNFKLLFFRVLIQVLGQAQVDLVSPPWDVDHFVLFMILT